MKQTQKVDVYLHPSFFSSIVSFSVLLYLLVTNVWSWARNSTFASQIAQAFEGSANSIKSADGMNAISTALSGSFVNEAFYLTAWASVGILCYFGYIFATNGLHGFQELLTAKSSAGASNSTRVHEFLITASVRLMLALIIGVYCIVFLQLLLPVAVLMFRAGSATLSIQSFIYILIGSTVILLTLHLFVILLRLFFMRVRVFGGSEDLALSQMREL